MEPEIITTISPTTHEAILTRKGATVDELALLAKKSAEAFESFRRRTTLTERKAIIRRALDVLVSRRDELARELTVQMGRPIAYTAKEIGTAVKRSEYLLKVAEDVLKDTPGEEEPGFRRWIRKEPLGPVLIIFAWNYPYLILVNSLIPALLAGNSVILKPSPQTPTIVEQVERAFVEAGLPSGVIQYFHSGSPAIVEALIRNPLVKHICFTGSIAGGLAVQQAASSRIVDVGLELGGNDAAYVRSDVDVAWAAAEIVDGAVFNSGQSCCAIERVYVDAKIHDKFIEEVQNVLKGYVLGDPLDEATHLGPVISARAKATVLAHVHDAIEKGAKDVTPPNDTWDSEDALPQMAKGNFVKPTLLTDVNHSMMVMREETFGPVIPVMRVDGDDEAVKFINDSDLGLTASIWTKDMERGRELAELLEVGTVFVNRCDYPSPDLAWTGWKNSGKGTTLSKFGFDQFVKLKSYHLKDYPK